MELKKSGKRSWKRRVPNHRGNNCGTFEAYEYRVCDRSAGIKTEGTARRLEGWHATQAVPSSNLLNRLNLSPFIPEFLSSIFNIFSVLPPEQRLSGYTSENPLKIAENRIS
jgi:hypothetical protein